MIYQKQFLKETTFTAIAIFIVVLAILVFTQGINLLGRAADGRVAIDAVLALVGFWTLGMTPLLLVLTAYISTLTVLTRYWRDSEMSIWLASGLSLRQWVRPVLSFALPLAVLVAVMQLAVLPWAELRSREYAEILKQKQNLSLVEAGSFQPLGKKNGRMYFVEQFDKTDNGMMKNLFVREFDEKTGRDNVVFAQSGHFDLSNNRRTLVLQNGYRYSGIAGQGDFDKISFEKLDIIISTTPKLVNPIDHRRTIPTSQLWGSNNPKHVAELMWRISLPLTVLLLSVLAIPISYFNPRSGNSYHVLLAVGFFLIYQNGLTLLRDAVEDGKIGFWLGLLPMHILILGCTMILLKMRSMPAQPFWKGLKQALGGKV
ncbi:LPS export ABC transporter permease LptF [Alysiella crassa]|uniref:Lipopolysaccharide export system permease protein LptF n=1 Tax=Alysiella crassa TaxID=153491 RepID=A0A376BM85_9NEIS|nr:LPS export ABC transporter permease LptF [Alysiella crassa]UOP08166.1 LPS export ABC transporter permease LptF [Alysiella crassa]SSY70334.1 Lipopolysaccharide export system permease protein lptF [Alysiella crassa]